MLDVAQEERFLAISVVIMAYNEVHTLASTVSEILSVLDAVVFNESVLPLISESADSVKLADISSFGSECAYEILIIDDGSTDGTGALADDLAQTYASIRVLHHPTNLGLGEAYRTGFRYARGEYLTFFPADGQYAADIIRQFLPLMDEVDMILGYLPENRRTLLTRVLSTLERLLYRLVIGPLPRFQSIMMFKRSLLDAIPLYCTGRGWGIVMEFVIKVSRGGYKVRSVPTNVRPRLSGTSKVNNWRTIWANFSQVLSLRRYL
mgnify:CR=1 FL=1